MRILIVEDAADVAEAVAIRLDKSGMACDIAECCEAAEDFLAVQRYDAIVLDINLPDRNGTELLRDMRTRGDRTPVLMLTALFSVDDRVSALDLGADDYLVKPFDQRELEARLRALVRREAEQKSDAISLGPLTFSLATLNATLEGVPLNLTRREATLLGLLLRNQKAALSKKRLYDGLFAFDDADVGLNAIELYIARLRKKLAGTSVSIETQRGVGYRIFQNE
ncbi:MULTISPECIES: response regulator transcription factor [Roseobacteraceae]|uniref:Tricarboxylate transport transcriptional regulator TctD n=1 Tax=Celeribacter baekdonensis B30 TaxID=1208323 RepID=K2IV46_9RHOB|nr:MULTISPECIES: response regulator transcription factor [Roseobacteraceae]EKE74216.1 tricarboxylate transport transcriptional regulator TctD [Celeribacter baekdonensis B30]KAB6716779.1 DNA-binding response regulator [Roseobacter sp. TSBP12]|tara:strand:+ start:1173 stop:1844 length:672 start_codon:yes stop_codon:yes gene_type:complete